MTRATATWPRSLLFVAALLGAVGPSAHAQLPSSAATRRPAAVPLGYCDFSNPAAPCDGSVSVNSLNADPAGRSGPGLRICNGPACSRGTKININGPRLQMARGSVAFWIRQNNNAPTAGPAEVFDTYPGKPYVTASFVASVAATATARRGRTTTVSLADHGLATGDPIRISSATSEWASVNGTWRITVLDKDRLEIPASTNTVASGSTTITLLKPGSVEFKYLHDLNGGGLVYGLFSTGKFLMPAGEWHHVAWTWTGDQHQVYRDGVLAGSFASQSPFPFAANIPTIRLGTSAEGTQDITIDDLTFYPFPLTPVEALAARDSNSPIAELQPHGVVVFAQWGPGEKKVKVTVDSGTGVPARRYRVAVTRDGQTVASQDLAAATSGSAEALIDLADFASGTYAARATVLDPAGVVGAVSTPYVFSKPPWLGNTLGLTDAVPAPYWQPITADRLQLRVVHREYSLAGGFGLPTQIQSLGENFLSRPVTLEVEQGGTVVPFTSQTVQIIEALPHRARWRGEAAVGTQIKVIVHGELEYDGMTLVTLRLEPTPGSTPTIGRIRLTTPLKAARARYVYAAKDQPYWWYVWSVRVPPAIGEFNNNLSALPRPNLTNNIFATVFSDDDRGLEIFHNNMAGWNINERKPWQRYVREADGTVSYVCELANDPFVLTEAREITVGFMATPVKRLPDDSRLAVGGAYGGDRAPDASMQYFWDWPQGGLWNTFQLQPTNLAIYKATRSNPFRRLNKKVLPFVNAHVLIPTTGENPDELAVLNGETLSDGWNGSPSRGMGDYWAWSMNRLLNDRVTPDVVDGYYIDESYGYQANASLLTGAGYIQSDGTHGIGLNLLRAREKFNRLAGILIAAGKAPNLWFHTTGTMFPHMWSHGLMLMDGERPDSGRNFYVSADSEASPDHFDAWNSNNSLLDPSRAGMGTWLLGIASARKFGFVSTMWQGLECCEKPALAIKQRRAECLMQMHDVLQQDQFLDWWKPKAAFGIDHPATAFRHYASQGDIVAPDPSVKVSYYQRPDSVLAYVANFGNAAWTGDVAVRANQINAQWRNPTRVLDAESRRALRYSQGAISLSVPRHDCRVVQLDYQR